jgi:hypothetical protein
MLRSVLFNGGAGTDPVKQATGRLEREAARWHHEGKQELDGSRGNDLRCGL